MLRKILFVGLLLMPVAGAAEACSRATVPGAQAPIRAEGRIDQGLIDKAIRAEVNYHRCRAGLAPLGEAGGLRKVAGQHAKWMARSRHLTHRSKTPGQATPVARLKASGLRFRAGSENIGQVARFQIDGRSFRIANASACGFLGGNGQSIPPHSYASLARTIVTLWMESSAHRRNILDRKVSRLGSGIGFDAKAPYCGNYYVSQTFAG
ncbi:CAP domain-containing protein [Defluviimonas sp. SAOS-178_SWC]|uniref:CAP domain-containing protein n=1 Tax=Defluviimonas sp. SAOS-178_SWC TaxID=3121287 RepID=UPI00322149E9